MGEGEESTSIGLEEEKKEKKILGVSGPNIG